MSKTSVGFLLDVGDLYRKTVQRWFGVIGLERGMCRAAQLWLVPRDSAGPPTGAHAKGEIYLDSAAALWVCVKGGPDSNWRKVTTTAA